MSGGGPKDVDPWSKIQARAEKAERERDEVLRLNKRLGASYEAKVEDLAKETLRVSELLAFVRHVAEGCYDCSLCHEARAFLAHHKEAQR